MNVATAVDWKTAQRVGSLIAGSPPYGGVLASSVQPLAHDFARHVGDYTGLELPSELPPLEIVDRPDWIAANLKTIPPLLESLTVSESQEEQERATESRPAGNRDAWRARFSAAEERLSDSLDTAFGHLFGAQFGAVTGVLSQLVLGQYEFSLHDSESAPRLLLVAPNLARTARDLNIERDELVSWVAIHEITHAVQFSGAPWLREHLLGMMRELLQGYVGSLAETPSGAEGDRSRTPDPRELLRRANYGELGNLLRRIREGEAMRVMFGEDRWQLFDSLQATMSLIEGHADHVMDAVGAEVLPSIPKLRAALTERREDRRGLLWQVLGRLLGLGMKMRQYEVGRRFCDAVVEATGPPTLTLAWRSPEDLPSTAELENPELWLKRIT